MEFLLKMFLIVAAMSVAYGHEDHQHQTLTEAEYKKTCKKVILRKATMCIGANIVLYKNKKCMTPKSSRSAKDCHLTKCLYKPQKAKLLYGKDKHVHVAQMPDCPQTLAVESCSYPNKACDSTEHYTKGCCKVKFGYAETQSLLWVVDDDNSYVQKWVKPEVPKGCECVVNEKFW